MNVLRTLYSCPSFEQGGFFYFVFILTLNIRSSCWAERVPQCCARDASGAGLGCISVLMNLDLNSNENLLQCHRYLAFKSNCISVVGVLYLVQLLWISQTFVILSKLSLRNTLRSESFLVYLIVRGEDAIICGIEIKKMFSFATSFWSRNQCIVSPAGVCEGSQALAEKSAELILSSSCCNTTSPIRLRSFLLSCFFLLLFSFLSLDVHESEPGWKPAGHRLALQPGIRAVALLREAIASLVLNQAAQLCWEVDPREH